MTAKLTEAQRLEIIALYFDPFDGRKRAIELAKSCGMARSYPDALVRDRKLVPRTSSRVKRIASGWERAREVGRVLA